jgi:type I restriction enzyme R subunit
VHRLLVEGVTAEYRAPDGAIRGAQARVLDFEHPKNNDWLAVNQFTVVENKHTRRPDVVLFVNGRPLAVIELKNAADEDAIIWTAFQQLQTYKAELPSLFAFNEVLLLSDGLEARVGTLTAGREWMKPWRTITGERLAAPARVAGGDPGAMRAATVPRSGARFHRLRGCGRRHAREEDGGLPSVPRGASGRRRDVAGC